MSRSGTLDEPCFASLAVSRSPRSLAALGAASRRPPRRRRSSRASTYERERPVHAARPGRRSTSCAAPRPVGLYRLARCSRTRSIVRRETVSAMQRGSSTQATIGRRQRRLLHARGRAAERHLPARRRARDAAERRRARAPGSRSTALLDVRRVALRRHLARDRAAARARTSSTRPPGTNGISLFTSRLGAGDAARSPARSRSCSAPFPPRRPERRPRRRRCVERAQRRRRVPTRAGTARARRARDRRRQAPGRGASRARS